MNHILEPAWNPRLCPRYERLESWTMWPWSVVERRVPVNGTVSLLNIKQTSRFNVHSITIYLIVSFLCESNFHNNGHAETGWCYFIDTYFLIKHTLHQKDEEPLKATFIIMGMQRLDGVILMILTFLSNTHCTKKMRNPCNITK